jgi:hypothetical protein
VQVERRAVRQRHTEDRWKDDRRVREHHRNDEPDEAGNLAYILDTWYIYR